MNIQGKITGIKYKVILLEDIKEVDIKSFDINEDIYDKKSIKIPGWKK